MRFCCKYMKSNPDYKITCGKTPVVITSISSILIYVAILECIHECVKDSTSLSAKVLKFLKALAGIKAQQ